MTDTDNLIRLLAYTGNPAAREAIGGSELVFTGGPAFLTFDQVDGLDDATFLAGLLPLYLAAAPGVECVPCKNLKASDGWRGNVACHSQCTGRAADPHALLRLAAGCARAAHRVHQLKVSMLHTEAQAITLALDACDAYLAEPSEEREKAWCDLANPEPQWLPFFPDASQPNRLAIQASAQLTGIETVARVAVELVSVACCGNYEPATHGRCHNCGASCQGTGRVPK